MDDGDNYNRFVMYAIDEAIWKLDQLADIERGRLGHATTGFWNSCA